VEPQTARSPRYARAFGAALCVAAVLVGTACSKSGGEAGIEGTLNVPNCWTGPFELNADYIAGVPYRQTLQIRMQSGSDVSSFSDGLSILLSDTNAIRPDAAKGFAGRYGEALVVDLPPEVSPAGVPVVAKADPAFVSFALYLQKSCRTQNAAVYAMSQVSIPADGTCDAPAMRGADPTVGCNPNLEAPAGVGSGRSLISFTSVFDGVVDEGDPSQRLTKGCFDVYLADPRDVAAGGLGPPPRCLGHLRGTFQFSFERGRPNQPFP
jgi:hypothetical protein